LSPAATVPYHGGVPDPQTHRPFGPLGADVPIIGQGTWKMGVSGARATEVAALRRGIERGLTHLDTAEMYGNGLAEETIGELIAGLPREKLFIVSKVLPQNATHRGTIAACEASLRRLGTPYLDVYLLHWRGRHPLEGTMRAMEELVDAGKIRALGVSNFDVPDLEEARGLLQKHPLACNQVLYHLGERYIENGVVDYCARNGIAVVGYSPFGTGGFPAPASPGGSALAAVAARHGANVTPRQVALAFLTRAAPLFAIPKASQVEHVEENAAALSVHLTAADIAEIDAAFPVRGAQGQLPMA
jgi:diketogulonate reductase-like aldo/keto reductase